LLIKKLSGLLSKDLAIDLGTANTLVALRGRGVVIREPSVVSLVKGSDRVLAVGDEAKRMLGRAPGTIEVIRPLRSGVIADFECTMAMLRYFITKVHRRQRLVRPRIIIGVPSGITQVEKRAVRESGELVGARAVHLIEEPMAAAIGAGLPISEPTGNMILDIGGGTTEVAIISLAGVVYSRSVRIAGDAMDDAIVAYVKRKYNLLIGERTGEIIKITLGTAIPESSPRTMPVRGRDMLTGLPKTVQISSLEVYDAMAESIQAIVDTVQAALERTPPELIAEIIDHGIVMAGGGALLPSLDVLLREETGLPVTVAEEPLFCVVHGVSQVLDDIDLLEKISV
jgi:rod shape-determining protein MreB and related proteins